MNTIVITTTRSLPGPPRVTTPSPQKSSVFIQTSGSSEPTADYPYQLALVGTPQLHSIDTATKLIDLARFYTKYGGNLTRDALTWDRPPGLDEKDGAWRDQSLPSKISNAQETLSPQFS